MIAPALRLLAVEAAPAAPTMFDLVLDTIALALVIFGALLCLTASIGLVRFRDVPTRLHAATKPQVLGLLSILVAVALALHVWSVVAFLVAIAVLQLATAPLAAHMVGRAAYRNNTIDRTDMFVDELEAAQRDGRDERSGR